MQPTATGRKIPAVPSSTSCSFLLLSFLHFLPLQLFFPLVFLPTSPNPNIPQVLSPTPFSSHVRHLICSDALSSFPLSSPFLPPHVFFSLSFSDHLLSLILSLLLSLPLLILSPLLLSFLLPYHPCYPPSIPSSSPLLSFIFLSSSSSIDPPLSTHVISPSSSFPIVPHPFLIFPFFLSPPLFPIEFFPFVLLPSPPPSCYMFKGGTLYPKGFKRCLSASEEYPGLLF